MPKYLNVVRLFKKKFELNNVHHANRIELYYLLYHSTYGTDNENLHLCYMIFSTKLDQSFNRIKVFNLQFHRGLDVHEKYFSFPSSCIGNYYLCPAFQHKYLI